MDIELNETQRQLKEMLKDFGEKEIVPYVEKYDQLEEFPVDIIKKATDLGLMGACIPEKYGGAGLDFLTYTLIIEWVSRYCQIVALALSAPGGMMGSGILLHGSEDQKQKYLLPLVKGEVFAGGGVTEPRSGSDVGGTETHCRKDGNSYILNGVKAWISFLTHAKWFITFATMDKSKRHKGLCAFIVEADWPGVSRSRYKNKVGFRPLSTGDLVFEDVRVPQGNLIGEEGQGFEVAMCAVENGRLSVASRCNGVAQACLEESIQYAKERIVFDNPIGRYQQIQGMLVDMVIGIEASRYFTYRLAQLKDKGFRATREASMAKYFASETLMKSAADAMQIFGAYSCSSEYNIGRYWRDAKFFQIIEGTNQIHRNLIAEYALGYRRERR
jgi:alkylation response protein AidB-like acyl-CoA dehydrogenase